MAAEEVGPDHFAQDKAPSQSSAVEKKSHVGLLNILTGDRGDKTDALNEKLHAGNFSDVEFVSEHAPQQRRAELGHGNRTHERRGDEWRMTDVGDVGENVQIQAGDADAGDAKGDDEEPECR